MYLRIMETKREKFVRLAENRTSKALSAINNIGRLSNKANYEYSEEDIKKIFKALKQSLSEAENSFREISKSKFKL